MASKLHFPYQFSLRQLLIGITLFCVLLACFVIAITYYIASVKRDNLWREAYSPDRSWSVHVYWRNASAMPPSSPGSPSTWVKIDLVVRDAHGNIVLRKQLEDLDGLDVGTNYDNISCSNTQAKVGGMTLEKSQIIPAAISP